MGAILKQHAKVFEESLGTLTGFTAQVHIPYSTKLWREKTLADLADFH